MKHIYSMHGKRSKHKQSKHKQSKHRHTRRMKVYTKAAKRSMRLKRKARRIMSSRHRHSKRCRSKHSKHMHGGANNNGATAPVQRVDPNASAGTSNINKNMNEGTRDQNSGNKALNGGGQRGGNSTLDLYAYAPPPGMMGPIPQPSQDAVANKLILEAAKISTTGQANAVYDNNVGKVAE